MEGFVEKILDVLLAIIIFFALLGVILDATNTVSWATLNIGGSVKSFSWVPYLLVLIILVAVVVLVYRYILKHKK